MNERGPGKNIVFVSLFGLTELYLAVARRMESENIRTYWITTNEYWTEYLIAGGVERTHILQLIYATGDFIDEETRAALLEEITRCEANCDLTINQILLMDRFLAERPRRKINEYIYLYYRDMKRFLQEHDITHVFAEPTNVNDLLLYMICRELGIAFVSPRDMRFPPKQMIFFEGYGQERVLPIENGAHAVTGREILKSFTAGRPTPYYFNMLNRRRVVHPGKIAQAAIRRLRLRRLVSGRSLTHYDAWGRIKLTVRRVANSVYMHRLCRYDEMDRIAGRLAFYGLHVQPENSIDVLGSYVSDQLKLIKDIRRALPFDMTLIVKEHPNFLGMKGPRFFRELRRIPNVRLIRHHVPTFDLYERLDLVLTVSGTTAYEAGLLGIPAVTFSPMYFNGLSSVAYCPDLSRLKELVSGLLGGFRRDFEADCRFMESLLRYSHPGYWTDPLFDRSVLDPENIEKVSGAFLALLRSWSLSTLSA